MSTAASDLVRRMQALAMQYWRAGPGSTVARTYLDQAIAAGEQASEMLAVDDPGRVRVDAMVGCLLGARFAAHGSGADDRERAVGLLDRSLARAELLAPIQGTFAAVTVAQLHLLRMAEFLGSGAALAGLRAGNGIGPSPDVTAAIRRCDEAIDQPTRSAVMIAQARRLRKVAEAMRPITDGAARLDLARMMQAMQDLQELMREPMGLGSGIDPTGLFEWPDLAETDPIEYPAPTIVADPSQKSVLPPRTAPDDSAAADADPLLARNQAHAHLAQLTGASRRPIWDQLAVLLDADLADLPPATLDALIAAAGLDRLVSAVALMLRERRDGNGWDDDSTEVGAASRSMLLAAAGLIPPDHPAAAVLLSSVGGLLDGDRPLSGWIVAAAGEIGTYAGAATDGSAIAAVVTQFCRAVDGLRAGREVPSRPLQEVVTLLSADYRWRGVFDLAARHVELADAVRRGDIDGEMTDTSPLVPVLAALLLGDVTSLRGAVDTLRGPRSSSLSAALGAVYLRLAVVEPPAAARNLDKAIGLLVAATRDLTDRRERLTTRSWWRLAEAYRLRRADGDLELSKTAGLRALTGWERRRAESSRFAAWMLADGQPTAAYVALEAAALSAEKASSGDLVVEDLIAIVTGVPVSVEPAQSIPDRKEVAAAVRSAGASSLIYLHPTADGGRTAAALVLDAATESVEVVAKVPVTDPLSVDDPSWSCVFGRYAGGKILVAAAGALSGLAIPAVRTADGRWLAEVTSVVNISSGGQLIGLLQRVRPDVTVAPLFVVNPRHDRAHDMAEVMVLRRLFYDRSSCVGNAVEGLTGPGTASTVAGLLAAASMIHLACGRDGTLLQLAHDETLDLRTAHGSGLVVLADSTAGRLDSFADDLITAGYLGVIGWRHPVPEAFAALALFMTHQMLVDLRLAPADAVSAVQRWALHTDRPLPPNLPAMHRHTAEHEDLAQPAWWSALAYHGC